jgi:hypothetical protein
MWPASSLARIDTACRPELADVAGALVAEQHRFLVDMTEHPTPGDRAAVDGFRRTITAVLAP